MKEPQLRKSSAQTFELSRAAEEIRKEERADPLKSDAEVCGSEKQTTLDKTATHRQGLETHVCEQVILPDETEKEIQRASSPKSASESVPVSWK